MKNTLLLLFAFLLLGGTAFWFVNREDTSMQTLTVEDRNFAVKNVEDIGKIFIATRQGTSNTFTRNGDEWILNGKYKAREGAMENLLSTISRVELAYIPPKAAIPHVVEILASHGLKVEIYDREGNNMKTYYVGGLTIDEEGTYMLMEGAEQPYVMKMPVFNGGLRVRYAHKEQDWRDLDVFGNDIEDIEMVSIEYPKQKNKSFVLKKEEDGEFVVNPFYEVTPKIERPLRKGFVETYMVGFERFVAENLINKHKHRDSISQMVPFAIMTVKNTAGEVQKARFHPLRKIGDGGLPITDEQVTLSTAVERYHVDHSRGDYYVVQHRNFGRAFWPYESFFEKEK